MTTLVCRGGPAVGMSASTARLAALLKIGHPQPARVHACTSLLWSRSQLRLCGSTAMFQEDFRPLSRADSRERLGLQLKNKEKVARRQQDAGWRSGVSAASLEAKAALMRAATSRNWDAARAAFDSLDSPEQVVYNSLLHVADRCRRRREAEGVFAEMAKQGVSRNVLAYTSLINLAARDGDTQRIQELMASLREEGLKPDVMVYSAALAGNGRACNVAGAVALWQEMLQAGVQPTSISFISLLNVFASAGDPASAREQMAGMQRFGLSPETPHWNALLKACLRKPDARAALAALEEMSSTGTRPNVVSYTAVLGTLHAEQPENWREHAEALCRQMQEQGVKPDAFFVEERVRGQLGELHCLGSRMRKAGLEALDTATLQSAAATLQDARETNIRVGPRTSQLEQDVLQVLSLRTQTATDSPEREPRNEVAAGVSEGLSKSPGADWVEVCSAEHGTYFWDRASGITQWERPDGIVRESLPVAARAA
eukprot:TRINITY_DN40621_c0_g1_i1.p1 TRINITY_DN40621_c0_g1~~TRINITY_DN40621_c0_g1_i1.p1  ORF type:complete len:504 (-),score=91.28 TRINITY_DN40621_c0_g1_i1:56-1513(-)